MGIVRKTKSVKLLLNLFENTQKALSVVQLVDSLQNEMNKTTVYRILDRLENEGIVHSLQGKDGLTWYAKCAESCSSHQHTDAHPHFQCEDCGTVECLEVDVAIPTLQDRKVTTTNIMLTGTCPKCV